MNVKLLTEHNLEFLILKADYTCSAESALVKMPHCWKSRVTAHILADMLFQEREHVKQELLETQKALQGIEIKEQQETADKQKLQW